MSVAPPDYFDFRSFLCFSWRRREPQLSETMADHHPDDLDQLLDSALDDFQGLNLNSSDQRSGEGIENKQDSHSLPSGVQGLGMGLPDLRSKKQRRLTSSGNKRERLLRD